MNEVDEQNAEDVLLIAVDMLHEMKVYDSTVLTPINFQMCVMLEHALVYYP